MKQLINCLTCLTYNSFSIFDHVLTNFPDRVSQSGLIDVGISDYQLIYCTKKTARIKSYFHKQITFRSLKNYSSETLRKIKFPFYDLFNDIHKVYENFIQKVMTVTDNLDPCKNKHVKGTSQNWFGGENITLR